ncbi:MAG: hypothetical protein ACKVOW_07575 [Chitinophagaceae bacterium]
MSEKKFYWIRVYFTGIVTIAICALLIWDHYHGGIPSHHLFANKDLPSISNWWGLLLLPILTWFLLYLIHKRIIKEHSGNGDQLLNRKKLLSRFVGSLLFGILLSVFFSFNFSDIPGFMMLGVFPLALIFPIYRAECLLGFVIGMTYTFGTVLPTFIGSILTIAAAILYIYVRPAILYLSTRLSALLMPDKNNRSNK